MHRILGLVIFVGISGCASAPPGPNRGEVLANGCHTPLGFIAEGRSATGYLHQIETSGQNCQQGTLSCEDGVWTGAYIYPSCVRAP